MSMQVVLIHGLGRTPLAMSLLGWRLSLKGYQTHYFGYLALAEQFEDITGRFVHFIEEQVGSHPYMIVTHSLGGIIVRASLPHLTGHLPRHLVMLAPPNHPPRMAKIMRSNPLFRLFTGDCGQKLGNDDFYKTLPYPLVPTTIVSGTRGWRGLFSPFEDEWNDAVIAVGETQLNGFEVRLVPATHPFIMNSRQVAQIVLKILQAEAKPLPDHRSFGAAGVVDKDGL